MSEEDTSSEKTKEGHGIFVIVSDLQQIHKRVRALGSNRSYSLSQTKIEEAVHWLNNRRAELEKGV